MRNEKGGRPLDPIGPSLIHWFSCSNIAMNKPVRKGAKRNLRCRHGKMFFAA